MIERPRRIAPRVQDWPVLVHQVAEVIKIDYDWSADVPGLSMPVMLVIGDADGVPPSHAVEFFGLLGGGRRDAEVGPLGHDAAPAGDPAGRDPLRHQHGAGALRRGHPVPRRRLA